MKRTFDIIVAGVFIAVLSPVMVIVAIATRWIVGSPIIYRSFRRGLHGKPFWIYTFRTTHEGVLAKKSLNENTEARWDTLIRRYGFNELPILFNILKGDISIVGPQPLKRQDLTMLSKEQVRRYHVKPGIVGLATIDCVNVPTRTQQIEMDVWYG